MVAVRKPPFICNQWPRFAFQHMHDRQRRKTDLFCQIDISDSFTQN